MYFEYIFVKLISQGTGPGYHEVCDEADPEITQDEQDRNRFCYEHPRYLAITIHDTIACYVHLPDPRVQPEPFTTGMMRAVLSHYSILRICSNNIVAVSRIDWCRLTLLTRAYWLLCNCPAGVPGSVPVAGPGDNWHSDRHQNKYPNAGDIIQKVTLK